MVINEAKIRLFWGLDKFLLNHIIIMANYSHIRLLNMTLETEKELVEERSVVKGLFSVQQKIDQGISDGLNPDLTPEEKHEFYGQRLSAANTVFTGLLAWAGEVIMVNSIHGGLMNELGGTPQQFIMATVIAGIYKCINDFVVGHFTSPQKRLERAERHYYAQIDRRNQLQQQLHHIRRIHGVA